MLELDSKSQRRCNQKKRKSIKLILCQSCKKINIKSSLILLRTGLIALIFFSLITLSACSNTKREKELEAEIETLKNTISQNNAEIKLLKEKVAGYETKPAKLIVELRNARDEGKYDIVAEKYQMLLKYHPESPEFKEGKEINDKIVAEALAKKEEAERERERKIQEEKKRIEAEKQEKLKALNKLKKQYDDVSGITWYQQPYFTHYNNENRVSVYIGSKKTSIWLRLKMSYFGDNWIFFDKAYLSYEGNTREITFDKYDDKKTENGYGGVWEWIDIQVSPNLEDYLREFAQYKNAKMRLSGKYTKTRNLTWDERQGIRDILKGYDALREGLDD